MPVSPHDRETLRRLAAEQAAIAQLPVHREKAEMWRRLNDLESVRPMVWINEICWNEVNVDDELTLRCTDPWLREVEFGLRTRLYQWRHLPADMIVDPYIPCPLVIRNSGFGLSEDVDIVRTDDTSDVVSRHFHAQIVEPEDIAKIKSPVITYDAELTEARYQTLTDILGDILPVVKVGIKGSWFAPWDELIRWWGVEAAMKDLVDRPEMVEAAIARLVDGYIAMLDQWEALNLLTRNDDNTRIGSGGYGHTKALPGEPYDPQHPRPRNLWGCATAQIFGAVSPRMHWDFALKHEMRWLERWGLTYYGCCEPLDVKMSILRRIPNLRKLSMSPWIDIERAVRNVGTDYVMSRKPNPAVLAEDIWRPERARQDLVDFLDRARGCHVEIILKDISTVRYDPRRLWDWARIAMEVVEDYQP
ncbi:MAG: hypothetical protein BWY52_00235 [Chloroflexi bacterium ADurb.Bin325]|nr:MAG: hypothetical protein BWY52_00235 [Chloroflexi bacterium ADurb.Bin325]